MPIRRLATWQAPVFLLNSRLGRFSAAPFPSPRTEGQVLGAPLLPKVRGHFAEFLLRSSLARLRLLASPTCVGLRYGRPRGLPAGAFLGRRLQGTRQRFAPPPRARRSAARVFPAGPPTTLHRASQPRLPLRFGVPPTDHQPQRRFRNVDRIPIAYASRPRLRTRLTRGGRTWPRNP